MSAERQRALLFQIRGCLAVVIFGLLLSGVTAFPLEAEVRWLAGVAADCCPGAGLSQWFARVHAALAETNAKHPFLAYGTDWLAYAHLVIAIAYIGPWRDPVRNRWVIDWGLICCATVPVLALTAGPVRGLPCGWMLVDSSFGILAAIPLLLARRWTRELERAN